MYFLITLQGSLIWGVCLCRNVCPNNDGEFREMSGGGGEHNTVQFMPAFVILTLVFLKKMLGIEHGSKSVDLKS